MSRVLPRSLARFWVCLFVLSGSILISGCPGTGVPDDNTNDNTAGSDITGEIITLRSSRQVSQLEPFISILYTVSGAPEGSIISSFYVPVVATTSTDYMEVGERVVIATNLPSGTNQAFNFVPGLAGPGLYRIGLTIDPPTGDNEEILSARTIQVQAPPDPMFIQPSVATTTAVRGEDVLISFDAGDPEGNVQWRLFYLTANDPRNVPADQLGTELAVGSGNVGSHSLNTGDLAMGEYRLGVSATDTGGSIAAVVARGDGDLIVTNNNGPVIRVVDEDDSLAPTIAITSPGAANVTLFLDQTFAIRFVATIREPGATGVVDLFYDADRNVSNGFTILATDLPASDTSFNLPTNLPQGTYNIGASVRDGINATVSTYAVGTVTIVRTPSLTVTAPNSTLPIPPSVPGETPISVEVRWSTNVPPSAGTVDVFARTVAADGTASGPEIPLLAPTSTTTTMTTFSSERSGVYRIFVRISFTSGDMAPLVVSAPQDVRVSSLPRVLWLGTLATTSPAFDGAIFEGVNFEDNAGTSFSPAGDLNDDGFDEFLIGARYGKPLFVNPSGVGPGEAYLIYGAAGADRLRGRYNLNSVGTSGLVGITLTGLSTLNNTDRTDGLSTVGRIPDADGDGLGELVFGFPNTNSAGGVGGILEKSDQACNGGLVILSSENSLLLNPTGASPVINLQLVGQRFTNMTVTPAPEIQDLLEFDPGDPTATPPQPPACVPGSDGIPDTVVGPGVGFIDFLAPTGFEQLGLEVVPPGTPPAPGVCVTQFVGTFCAEDGMTILMDDNPGSGFYPAGSIPLEPFGARILGTGMGDGFGTSFTSSNPLDDDSPGDLIVSAPNRSAMSEDVAGLDADIANSGVGYLFDNRNLWNLDPVFTGNLPPPTPHQYLVDEIGSCGGGRAPDIDALQIAGDSGDRIANMLGIEDFNADGRNDIAIGAPLAGSGQGRVYIAFRRDVAIEGDFILDRLELSPNEPERLTGLLLRSTSTDAFGSSLAGDLDFNGDGFADLVIGSPSAGGGVGEIIVVFSRTGILSGLDGITIQTLLATTRTATGEPVAARIRGNPLDSSGRFGFNVANAGDVDGDGRDDLLVSAPNATPRFDPDPSDENDVLTAPGIDANFDGLKDDVSGPRAVPDGVIDLNDNLTNAGLVYIISSRSRLDRIQVCSTSKIACNDDDDCADNETCTSGDFTISIDQLGTAQLPGFMIAGRRAGDRIGGGDAGDMAAGGIAGKAGRGRSLGLSAAGDVDGDGRADFLIGSILADPRRDPNTGVGVQNGGEAYLIYGSAAP